MSDFSAAVDQEFAKIERQIAREISPPLEDSLRTLNAVSPIWTGWYANNHRLWFGNNEVEVVPATRPNPRDRSKWLQLPSINTRVTREMAHFRAEFVFGEDFGIGNGTFYAAEIEHGTPRHPDGSFYHIAWQTLEARLAARFA